MRKIVMYDTTLRDGSQAEGISYSVSDKLLIAHKLTYYTCRHADLTGTVKQTVSHGGSGTAVECVPHSGYHFVEWSDGVMTASRTDSNVLKSKYMRARVTRGVVS